MSLERVLVAYDGSEPSERALDAIDGIVSNNTDVEILFVHIMILYSSGSAAAGIDTVVAEEVREIQEHLQEVASAFPNQASVKILRGTSPADLIVRCAKEEQCDLIVMGSRGKGGVKGYLGSVSYAVVKDSPVSVLIAK